jgi:8-oxo-dGTP pyrophosphatase MutT (NUDIX family)
VADLERDLANRATAAAAGDGPAELPPAIPAATVVVLRDRGGRLEALMVRRNSKLAFAGGHWVFPGGRVDPGDEPVVLDPADPANRQGPADEAEARARAAAVRETHEEAGLVIDPVELVWFAHWTPPPISPKRFATWFFAAPAPDGDVIIDGGEIHDHAWLTPEAALAGREAGEIELSPPTWITLFTLAGFADVDTALDAFAGRPPEFFATRISVVDGGVLALYAGDAGYDHDDPDLPGPRHRLAMMDTGWTYERDPEASAS